MKGINIKSLRSYQPEVNIYEEMQKAMDKNLKRLIENDKIAGEELR